MWVRLAQRSIYSSKSHITFLEITKAKIFKYAGNISKVLQPIPLIIDRLISMINFKNLLERNNPVATAIAILFRH